MSSIIERLMRQRKQKEIQDEIERLEIYKKRYLALPPSKRTFEEQKFLDGVDESIQNLILELRNS